MNFLKTKHKSYIFSGDLNALADSFIIEGLVGMDNLQHLGPDFLEKTWTTKPFDYHGFKENDLAWRLDYLFVTKDISADKIEIVKTDVSDHLPIFAELTI